MFFLHVSVYQNMVCLPNASELELFGVLVKNCRFLNPTTDILNQCLEVRPGNLCFKPISLWILMYPKSSRILLLCRCLSFSGLFHIHSITCVLLNFHMFRVGRFLIACFFVKWKIHVHGTNIKKYESVYNEQFPSRSPVLEHCAVLSPLI